MPDVKTCPVCGTDLASDFFFCPMCGAQRSLPQVKKAGVSLQELYITWLPARAAALSKKSLSAYKRAWKRISRFADCDICKIPWSEVQRIVSSLSYEDAKKLRSLVHQMYDMVNTRFGVVVRNPFESMILPKRVLRHREAFHEQEIEKMWKAYYAGDMDARLPLALIYTGLRTGELFNVKEKNIDLEQRVIVGVGTKTEMATCASIILPQIIVPVFQNMCIGLPERLIVDCNKTTFYKHYYSFLERAGVRPLSPYSCRHTYASLLTQKGLMPIVIQRAMRHVQYTTTAKIYSHLDPQYVHEALDMI